MKPSTFMVEPLDEGSRCVTRNGSYEISAVSVEQDGKGMVSISFVSRRLKRRLNSGAIISDKNMDRMAKQWLRMRGHKSDGIASELLRRIEDSAAALRGWL